VAYRSFEGNQFRKEIRKVRKPEHIKAIREEYADIISDPKKPTEPLKGNFAVDGLRYRKIKTTVPEYRMMFMLYDCRFSLEADGPTCSHNGCPVGAIDEETVEFDAEDGDSEQDGTGITDRVNDLAHDTPCDGLIKHVFFGPRELFNNLYKLRAKDIQKYL
jgi:hypothetical protein